jgi:hypothetical protein
VPKNVNGSNIVTTMASALPDMSASLCFRDE